LGSLPTEAIFGTPDGVFFTLVKDTFVIALLGAQKVEDNASKLVGRGCDRLRSAKFACDTAKEFSQKIFGVMEGLRAHAKGGCDSASNSSAFGKEYFSAADLSLGTKP
jgi:hypothetical protein